MLLSKLFGGKNETWDSFLANCHKNLITIVLYCEKSALLLSLESLKRGHCKNSMIYGV